MSYGKPGGSYSYSVPTPSVSPTSLSGLDTPSSSLTPSAFNLQVPTASVAPQVFLPAPDPPSVINLSAPSVSPSLLVENVVGAGQYGQPLVNIRAQPLGQPLGLQSFGDQSLGFGLSQLQFGLPLTNQGLEQPGFNFGGSLLSFGLPQLPLESSQLPLNPPQVLGTPAPDLSLNSAQLNVGAGPTIATPSVSVQGPGAQTEAIEVQKHIYVYVAPEQPEVRLPPRQIVVPSRRKHYKIIFIKAPSPSTPRAPVLPSLVQDEEKTVVYVLVKKPEEQPEIKIHPAPPTTPTKPEVYFINYNTKKESIVGGSIPSGPVPINSVTENIPVVEDVAKNNDPTVPTVRIGDTDLHTSVDLNLNKASLNGGSALSLSVTGSPSDKTLHVSSTPPPKYGPPGEK